MSLKPFVSVVIPNLNNRERLQQCLDALLDQTYPRDRYEVIVIDNGSTDGSMELAKQYPFQFYEYLSEKSPYPCRNLGIQKARGEIVGLLDSNCIPVNTWISAGVQSISEGEADIVIGPLSWEFSSQPSVYEKFDYILSVIKKEDIPGRTALPGGNLFVSKELFQVLGYFSADTRSLGDIEWTEKAHKKGYKFGFATMAKVSYPAKSYDAFVKKAIRLGKGREILLKKEYSDSAIRKWIIMIKLFLPPSPKFYCWLQKRNKREGINLSFFSLFFLAWLYKMLRGVGMLST